MASMISLAHIEEPPLSILLQIFRLPSSETDLIDLPLRAFNDHIVHLQ